jgi:endonuclease G
MFKRFLVLLALIPTLGLASGCLDHYPEQKEIVFGQEHCNKFFVTRNVNQFPVYVSEYLQVGAPIGTIKRVNAFHADKRDPDPITPAEYTNSGYDRGHMAPAADASTPDEMRETFLMTNMTPQEPTLNRGEWKHIEDYARYIFSISRTDMWIETIAVYNKPKYIGRIPVPTGYWKIITVNGTKEYYYADNKPYAKVSRYSSVNITKILTNTEF